MYSKFCKYWFLILFNQNVIPDIEVGRANVLKCHWMKDHQHLTYQSLLKILNILYCVTKTYLTSEDLDSVSMTEWSLFVNIFCVSCMWKWMCKSVLDYLVKKH